MKSIKSARDLAINGAPPAFTEILHVGSPNLGSRSELNKHLDDIYERRWVTNNGPLVQELEGKIASRHDVKHCVAMSNGTIALEIAIRALELKGEVIVPSYTFIATAHALHWQAITPVFADIDPITHHLDPAAVRRMITPNTTGIIGVHLWGRCAPVEELQQVASEYGLKLLFDAAHAFDCSHNGAMVGRFGSSFRRFATVPEPDEPGTTLRRLREPFAPASTARNCLADGRATTFPIRFLPTPRRRAASP
jgi:dTDP-4-amino-4,6-dideoxygalactose transaminase